MFAFFRLIDRFIVIVEFVDTHWAVSSLKPIQSECWTTTNFCLAEWRLCQAGRDIVGAMGSYTFPTQYVSSLGLCFLFLLRYLKWLLRCSEFGVGPNFQYLHRAESIKKRGLYLSSSGSHCNLIDSFYCINIFSRSLGKFLAAIVPNWPFYDPIQMPRDQKPTPGYCWVPALWRQSLTSHIRFKS